LSKKTLDTLVEDIGSVLCNPPEITDEQANALGTSMSNVIREKLGQNTSGPALRMSSLGTKCLRKLWYKENKPEAAIPLRPEARLKFLYGDIIEVLILWLAKVAGHEVTGEQDTLRIGSVEGHRDAVVDGVTVDVKSASSYSFKKFQDHLRPEDDAFGYLDQLGAYSYAGKTGNTSAFIAVDKTLGHIHVDKHEGLADKDYEKLVEQKKAAISQPEPPPRAYFTEDDGKSGNQKLGIECSYCEFRTTCWPGLRAFNYSGKPRYLTKVTREPNVPEMNPHE
jgi:hypothetical protein